MHSVNLDLLRTSGRHYLDGQPKDPHARHQAEHLAILRAARHVRWLAGLDRLRRAFAPPVASTALSKPVQHGKT